MKFRLALALVLGAACSAQNETPAPTPGSGPTVVTTAVRAPNFRADSVPGRQADTTAGALLDSLEFTVDGLEIGLDSGTLRTRVGAPDSVTVVDFPFETGAKVANWYYSSLTGFFGLHGTLKGVELLDASRSTQRGLRVGDAEARIVALYGTTEPPRDGEYEYRWAWMELLVLRVQVTDGRVRKIYLGWLDD